MFSGKKNPLPFPVIPSHKTSARWFEKPDFVLLRVETEQGRSEQKGATTAYECRAHRITAFQKAQETPEESKAAEFWTQKTNNIYFHFLSP